MIKKGLFDMDIHKIDEYCLKQILNEYLKGDLDRHGVRISEEKILTGFQTIDELLGGMIPGELYLIGGRPAIGKSIFMYNILNSMCVEGGIETLLISPDASAGSVFRKVLSIMTGCGYLNPQPDIPGIEGMGSITDAAKKLQISPLWIEDSVFQTLDTIRGVCRKAKLEHGIKVVIIDSWEGMKIPLRLINEEDGADEMDPEEQWPDGQSEEEEEEVLIDTCGKLKQIAGEAGVVLLVNKRLNRDIEMRRDHYPKPYDFSLPIEAMEEATGILTLYHDAYYNLCPYDDEVEFHITAYRNRNGDEHTRHLILNRSSCQLFDDPISIPDNHDEYYENDHYHVTAIGRSL